MEELAEWLKQFQKPLLVCHNGRAFDSIILLKNCMKISCSWPLEGFVDSFFLKEAIPSRKCYKLQALVKGYMSFI